MTLYLPPPLSFIFFPPNSHMSPPLPPPPLFFFFLSFPHNYLCCPTLLYFWNQDHRTSSVKEWQFGGKPVRALDLSFLFYYLSFWLLLLDELFLLPGLYLILIWCSFFGSWVSRFPLEVIKQWTLKNTFKKKKTMRFFGVLLQDQFLHSVEPASLSIAGSWEEPFLCARTHSKIIQ